MLLKQSKWYQHNDLMILLAQVIDETNDNLLKTVPKQIGYLTNLEEMSLSHNFQLKYLPEELGNLNHLNKLKLIEVRIKQIKPSLFTNTNLKSLHIKRFQEKNEPKPIQSIQIIDNQIANLVQLEILQIRDYRIHTLPSMDKLTSLKSIDLGKNQIRQITSDFLSFKQLEILLLDGNQFTSLPLSFLHFANLKQLNFNYNKIKKIKVNFQNGEHFPKLQKLFLSHNQIEELDQNLFPPMPALTILDVSHNILKVLPESIGNLQYLKILRAQVNFLTRIPSCVTKLAELQILSLSRNQIKKFEHIMLPNTLIEVDVSENKITELPQIFEDDCGLISFNIKANKIKKLPLWINQLKNLKMLNASANHLDKLDNEITHSFRDQSLLCNLDISSNSNIKLNSSLLARFPSLATLRCSIKQIPSEKPTLQTMQILTKLIIVFPKQTVINPLKQRRTQFYKQFETKANYQNPESLKQIFEFKKDKKNILLLQITTQNLHLAYRNLSLQKTTQKRDIHRFVEFFYSIFQNKSQLILLVQLEYEQTPTSNQH